MRAPPKHQNTGSFDLETYSNTEVIAVDQDPLGVQVPFVAYFLGRVRAGNFFFADADAPKQGAPVLNTCPNTTVEEIVKRRVTGALVDVPACVQVWAKKLVDGGVAVNMVNCTYVPCSSPVILPWPASHRPRSSLPVGIRAKTITCGAPCLRAMGFTGAVHVRDLWQHADLPGPVSAVAATVRGNGASVTYKVTAASTAATA